MQTSPAAIGRRYSPLIVLAAVQLVLVLVAPSIGGKTGTSAVAAGAAAGGTGSAGGTAGGTAGAAGSSLGGDTAGTGGTGSSGAAGGGIAGGGSAGSGGGAGITGAATGAGGATGGAAADRSDCAPSGLQMGVVFYMPPCAPVWHGGDNGGATMQGVTANRVTFVYDNAQANPEVNAILAQEGLAETAQQKCTDLQAWTKELNKRWNFYGRKLVSLDGPGNNKGSAQQSGCNFPYFQSQCSLTPPDPPCQRAEADEIAAMKPAIVISPGVDPAFYDQAAKDHLIVAGGETEPDSYHQQAAPYYYDVFMNGTRAMTMAAEFYCKQLYAKPVQFAGSDVEHPIGSTSPPRRKLAITYPATNGDPTYALSANLFIKLVTGGMCGSSSAADSVKAFPYQSDITTAEQQSTTTVSGMKSAGITTVVFFGDPIAPVFFSNTADSQGYHPEVLISGTGLVDYDVLGQLYNKNVWQHAFGPSTLTDYQPFPQLDQSKAWQDAGNSGVPDGASGLDWAYFNWLGNAVQLAGPHITPLSIRQGLFTAPPEGGDHFHTTQEFGRPDDYTGLRDERIVFWCNNQRSPINNQNGVYVSIFAGQRYQLGRLPTPPVPLFPHGTC